MSRDFVPEQLVRYSQYLDSIEKTLLTGGMAMDSVELHSIGLSLAHVGDILDQDIAATAQHLGRTSVDPSLKVG